MISLSRMTKIKYKRCSVCKETLAQTEFSTERRSKDGLNSRCKTCVKEQHQTRVATYIQYRRDYKLNISRKICNTCDKVKPMSEFQRRASNFDGREHRCKECKKEYRKRKKQSRYTQDDNPLVWLLKAAAEESHVEVYI